MEVQTVAEPKKYYWLKLKRDFFKRHDIQIIEAMPNGKDYILFYLKLLCESVDHEGNLRFSDQIPYNEDMLSTITNTNVDIVRSAIKIFTELKMMEVLDDGTYFMNEVQKMIGCETEWAQKKRDWRERKRLELLEDNERTKKDNVRQEIELEKEIDIDKDIIINNNKPKRTRFVPPTLEEVQAYCQERDNSVDAERFIDYYTSNGWLVGKNKMKDWKAAVRTWEKSGYNNKPQQEQGSGNIFVDMLNEMQRGDTL